MCSKVPINNIQTEHSDRSGWAFSSIALLKDDFIQRKNLKDAALKDFLFWCSKTEATSRKPCLNPFVHNLYIYFTLFLQSMECMSWIHALLKAPFFFHIQYGGAYMKTITFCQIQNNIKWEITVCQINKHLWIRTYQNHSCKTLKYFFLQIHLESWSAYILISN